MGLYLGKGHSIRAEAEALWIRNLLSMTLTDTSSGYLCKSSKGVFSLIADEGRRFLIYTEFKVAYPQKDQG